MMSMFFNICIVILLNMYKRGNMFLYTIALATAHTFCYTTVTKINIFFTIVRRPQVRLRRNVPALTGHLTYEIYDY